MGHNAGILQILVNSHDGHILSLSEDKVIKVWDDRTLNCIQTVWEKASLRPENFLSAIFFDNNARQLLTAANKIESWPVRVVRAWPYQERCIAV